MIEGQDEAPIGERSLAYQDRRELYRQIEEERDSKVIAYVTGDRPGLETSIAADVLDFFVVHLDEIGVTEKISLVLYTRGGGTIASWSVANLLRTFCKHLEVIVPLNCHSGGTLICLAADTIVMTRQATLSPIDPSINTPLNPEIPGASPGATMPVSVEDVNAYLEQARQWRGDANSSEAFGSLTKAVHPLVIGYAFRVRSQIRMLGQRLLSFHMADRAKKDAILDFLCSDSGSHDYTINGVEARNELNLPVEAPDPDFYIVIKELYDSFANQLKLREPLDLQLELGDAQSMQYEYPRGVIESTDAGAHTAVTAGVLTRHRVEVQPGIEAEGITDQRTFDGWRYQNA